MTIYNATKLDIELKSAGIEFSGCNSEGVVLDMEGNPIQSQAAVIAVLAAHDPVDYSISPALPVIKVGGTARVNIQAQPNTTFNILVDSAPVEVETDVDGYALLEFTVNSTGEYVVEGESGELANCIVIIKAA